MIFEFIFNKNINTDKIKSRWIYALCSDSGNITPDKDMIKLIDATPKIYGDRKINNLS